MKKEINEFVYSESVDLGKGRHRQIITFNGKEVGFLITKEINFLSPLQESYIIPDVEYGLVEGGGGLAKGKKGWIDFRTFEDYDPALNYVRENFERIAYLFEYGDFD